MFQIISNVFYASFFDRKNEENYTFRLFDKLID